MEVKEVEGGKERKRNTHVHIDIHTYRCCTLGGAYSFVGQSSYGSLYTMSHARAYAQMNCFIHAPALFAILRRAETLTHGTWLMDRSTPGTPFRNFAHHAFMWGKCLDLQANITALATETITATASITAAAAALVVDSTSVVVAAVQCVVKVAEIGVGVYC